MRQKLSTWILIRPFYMIALTEKASILQMSTELPQGTDMFLQH